MVAADFEARAVKIFRPYPDETPWELLEAGGVCDPRALTCVLSDETLLRVAKHGGGITGVYAIKPLTSTRFQLLTLVVDGAYRRRGLGRWLLGHALGLAETKGAREVVVMVRGPQRFLRSNGFVDDGTRYRLELTPE